MDACKALRAAGHKGFRAYAPLPEHELLEEGLALKHSPVRVFTLAGGLTGAATGFAFTSWTSMDWPLVTGGKPILLDPGVRGDRLRVRHPLRGAFHRDRTLHQRGAAQLPADGGVPPGVLERELRGVRDRPAGAGEAEVKEILSRHAPAELREDPEGFDV